MQKHDKSSPAAAGSLRLQVPGPAISAWPYRGHCPCRRALPRLQSPGDAAGRPRSPLQSPPLSPEAAGESSACLKPDAAAETTASAAARLGKCCRKIAEIYRRCNFAVTAALELDYQCQHELKARLARISAAAAARCSQLQEGAKLAGREPGRSEQALLQELQGMQAWCEDSQKSCPQRSIESCQLILSGCFGIIRELAGLWHNPSPAARLEEMLSRCTEFEKYIFAMQENFEHIIHILQAAENDLEKIRIFKASCRPQQDKD